jgi:hypothetical protein
MNATACCTSTFFELAGDPPVVVDFVVSDAEAAALIALVGAERASLFYVRAPVEFGVTRDSGSGPASYHGLAARLQIGVIRRPHHGTTRDARETKSSGKIAELPELGRRDEALDREVIAARL